MRQREFNTHNALTNAMEVFWLKGYKGASLDDLCTAMEIGKSSFYAAFGSKYELFIKILKHYGKTSSLVSQSAALLNKKPAKIAIELLLASVVDRAINTKRGCMFGKTAFEFWQSDENILNVVSNGVNQVEKTFFELITRGQKNSEIPAERNAHELARFFTCTFYGLQVMASAKVEADIFNDVIENTMKALD